MKLKTKFEDEDFRLGEVVEALLLYGSDQGVRVIANAKSGGQHSFYYNSIKELTDHWEDAPGVPKRKYYYYISALDEGVTQAEEIEGDEVDEFNKQVGNYFETKEEAESAVRKLKAWKRLKDKGFEFVSWARISDGSKANLEITAKVDDYVTYDDLDLLFGGE